MGGTKLSSRAFVEAVAVAIEALPKASGTVRSYDLYAADILRMSPMLDPDTPASERLRESMALDVEDLVTDRDYFTPSVVGEIGRARFATLAAFIRTLPLE